MLSRMPTLFRGNMLDKDAIHEFLHVLDSRKKGGVVFSFYGMTVSIVKSPSDHSRYDIVSVLHFCSTAGSRRYVPMPQRVQCHNLESLADWLRCDALVTLLEAGVEWAESPQNDFQREFSAYVWTERLLTEDSDLELSDCHVKNLLNGTISNMMDAMDVAHPADWVDGVDAQPVRVPDLRHVLPHETLFARPHLGDDGALNPVLVDLWRRSAYRVTGAPMPYSKLPAREKTEGAEVPRNVSEPLQLDDSGSFVASTDPSVLALKQAILLCWEQEPDKR